MSASIPALPSFHATLGPLLLGGMFAMSLWGITCVQTYTYFNGPSRDRAALRATIASLMVLDTFDTALNIHLVYHYMVSNYLNFTALLFPTWSVILHVGVTALSNFIIRALFSIRIYHLSGKGLLVTGLTIAISMADLVTGIIITVKAFQISSFLELETLSTLLYATFAAGTGADLVIAITLCWYLRKARTGFKNTDGLIKTLMRYTINTGLIVAIDAAAGMILYIVMPLNFIFLGPYLLLSKLYLNSYLATMNSRQDLRDKMDDHVSINLTDLSNSRNIESQGPIFAEKSEVDTEAGKIAVSIHTLVDKHSDKPRNHFHRPSDDSASIGRAF
ncbi:hypothetical protein BKA70DRAFT_1297173 [Coprinopsis sp. MPI-PUGE-AT-0042]|nr:hypothetical protein BKA70DRAFT_1297173 [Coprinopsis sp. MPI-PUGE-AT-0042]